MKYPLVFVLVLLFYGASAQYEKMLHKPYSERITDIQAIYLELVSMPSAEEVIKRVKEIKRFAQTNQDRELELEMDLFWMYYTAFVLEEKPEVAVPKLKQFITKSEEAAIPHIKIRAIRLLSDYYWYTEKNYELAFEQYLLLDRALSEVTPAQYPEMATDLLKIGEAYYFLRDYKHAKWYFKKISFLPETSLNTLVICSAKNSLGLCYQNEGDLKYSDFYFNAVLKTSFPSSLKAWKHIAMGNLGTNCYYRTEYDKAIPLLETDYMGAEAVMDYGPAGNALILLGEICLEQKNYPKAWVYLNRAGHHLHLSPQKDRLRKLYPALSKWYSANNRPEMASIYLDSSLAALHDYYNTFSALNMLRAQQKIALQEQELKLAEITLVMQKKKNERNIFMIIVGVLCLTLIALYYGNRKRQRIKNLELESANNELNTARLNVSHFMQNLSEKNRLIEQLLEQEPANEKNDLIRRLQQSTILTDEDWISFKSLFNQAYPGFLLRLKQAHPDLSASDTRCLLLMKLNMSYKEIASILGISPNTVHVMRHRIRKKLHLSDNEEMEKTIHTI